MATPLHALELADAGILCAGPGGLRMEPSPGLARTAGGGIDFGPKAQAHLRLEPRAIRDDFWQALDEEPLGPPFRSGLRNADLVHGHLASIRAEALPGGGEVLLALHGARKPPQLALLLGIVRAAGLGVTGLVDAALAATAGTGATEGRFLHVDFELHCAIVTEIVAAAGALRRIRVEATPTGTGLARLHQRWADFIGTVFVRERRWDPRHDGVSDQALWEALPALLAEACTGPAVTVRLGAPGRPRAVELRSDDLVDAARATWERIAALATPAAGTVLLLSDRASRLPGLVPALARASGAERSFFLAPGAAALGALAAAAEIHVAGDELPFVTRLGAGPASGGRR